MSGIRKHLGIKNKLNFKTLSVQDVELAREYSEGLLNVASVSSLKRTTPEKYKKDHYRGKLAEMLIASLFFSWGWEYVAPDLEIRTKSERATLGYDVDLTYEDFSLHVKSCEVSDYPESWLFGAQDPIVWEPPAGSYVALVVTDTGAEVPSAALRGLVPATDLRGLYREPKAGFLKDIKKALYLSDL